MIESVSLKFDGQLKLISFYSQKRPASYSREYINDTTGKVTVDIPKVYELSNILLALSDYYYQSNYGMNLNSAYFKEVLAWFSPYKEHQIFKTLVGTDYYGFVENGPAYEMLNEKIIKSQVYTGFRANNDLQDKIGLLEDFSKRSEFDQFYQQHQLYYAALKDSFYKDSKVPKIWQWLESNFPQKYQSYKVFFSPLGPGNHSARMYENNGFKEAIMFISGPNRYDSNSSENIKSIKLTRSFFTEIVHAYVNPSSGAYIDNISSALKDLRPWYKGGAYNKPYLVFNEYMTWAAFSLYALDNYTENDYLFAKDYIEKFMIKNRGFKRFKKFNDELTRLYVNRQSGQQIVHLYPAILNWMHQFSDKSKE